MDNTAAGIERFYREEFGRILATLIRVLGDFDLAEDAAQDAFASAVEQWHRDGLPDNPRAWIIGVARHKAIDRLRRQTRFNDRREELIRNGVTPQEARRRARLEFGGLDRTKEECRDARAAGWTESLIVDLRYGVRVLRKSPGFAAAKPAGT